MRWIDAPTACTTGGGEPGTTSAIFGSSVPFDRDKLVERYPAGKSQYLAMFEKALDRTIEAGFLLSDDRQEILELAEAHCYNLSCELSCQFQQRCHR